MKVRLGVEAHPTTVPMPIGISVTIDDKLVVTIPASMLREELDKFDQMDEAYQRHMERLRKGLENGR